MSILGSIEKPKDRPPIITICGDAGALFISFHL